MATSHVVIEGDEVGAGLRYRDATAAAAEAGSLIRGDWTVPPASSVVCTGTISSPADAQRALLAALDGARLVVWATADRETIDRFLDDLRRLGDVDHLTADRAAPRRLGPEQRALLALLAEGLSVSEAARELGLARRTADRRLAAARGVLEVSTTAEAIIEAWRTRG